MNDVILAEVTRGGVVESVHAGSGVAVNRNGELLAVWGNANRPIFPRSAMKSLQALTVLSYGTVLSEQQTALACASHHGEVIHENLVQKWLTEMRLTAEHLSCGPDLPRYPEDQKRLLANNIGPSRIYHNCSGKHCSQLAFCQHQGWDIFNYQEQDHPAQKAMLVMLSELAEENINNIGIDGCTLPAPQLTLMGFARALAKISAPQLLTRSLNDAAQKIIESTIRFPELTGGSKASNSLMTAASNKKFFAKNGAEGVYAVILPEAQVAMALKIADGNMRGADVAIAGMLFQMADDLNLNKDAIKKFCSENVTNSNGTKIGTYHFSGIKPSKS